MIHDSQNPLIDDTIEANILRSCLDFQECATIAFLRLTGLSFGNIRRGKLFTLIRKVFQKFGHQDELALMTQIRKMPDSSDKKACEEAFLEMQDTRVLIYNLDPDGWCDRVLDLYARREAIRKADELKSMALDQARDIAKEFTQAAQRVERQINRHIVTGSIENLATELQDAKNGARYAVPWPWPILSKATNALMPGTLTVICGSPGASKSLAINQCLLSWYPQHKCASLVLEDGVTYHMRRALAQLAEESGVTEDYWCKTNPVELDRLTTDHGSALSAFGKCLHGVDANEQPTIEYCLDWLSARVREGCRIIAIDPVTMIQTDGKPWKLEEFVLKAKQIIEQAKASLVVVTHPRKQQGFDRGSITLDDLSGSAAVQRFSQCIIWLQAHSEEPKSIRMHVNEPECDQLLCNRTMVVLKARNSWGGGDKFGFWFDRNSLTLIERGQYQTGAA